jgi:hypothetical protein
MENIRDFNCKISELPVICGYVAHSLEKDLADFTAYSPKFDGQYLLGFKSRTNVVFELVNPAIETADLKVVTNRLYGTMDGLIEPINRLTGYVKLAKPRILVSVSDFGLTALRRQAKNKDAEGAIQSLQLLNANVIRYKDELTEQGFTDELAAHFTNAAITIQADNQKQYEILNQRKRLVEANVGLLNELHGQLSEILEIGKILFKSKKDSRLQEYTFDKLKKRVRISTTPSAKKEDATEE